MLTLILNIRDAIGLVEWHKVVDRDKTWKEISISALLSALIASKDHGETIKDVLFDALSEEILCHSVSDKTIQKDSVAYKIQMYAEAPPTCQ